MIVSFALQKFWSHVCSRDIQCVLLDTWLTGVYVDVAMPSVQQPACAVVSQERLADVADHLLPAGLPQTDLPAVSPADLSVDKLVTGALEAAFHDMVSGWPGGTASGLLSTGSVGA